RVRPPRGPKPPRVRGAGDCDDEDDSRIFAIQALMHSNSERAVPLLRKVMERRDSASVCLRRFATMVAAQQRSAEATDLLLTAARNDPDSEVRTQAIFWLSQVNDPRVVPILDSVMRSSNDEDLQRSAIFALSQQRSPEARRLLRSYVERDDIADEARSQALHFLAMGNDPDDMAFLRNAYAKVKSPEVKQQIMAGMLSNRSPEHAKWLIGIAKDRNEDMEVRKQALFFAGMAETSTEDLLDVYNSLPDDPELREHMLVVLGQRSSDPAAVTHLLEIARTEKDPELRKMAVFWLSQSDDPRATKLLEDMLEE
ncbi:MAG TPA: HEAT repeat domain-containing protein, partial [Gemmatimonadales bacterium]|nr:HEAT repeat domain-containing protein [Gemmatimonadales bacterium]